MLLLGYAISDVEYSDIDTEIIKIVKSEEECSTDKPRLIVGLDKAKSYAKIHNLNFDILEHKFSNGDMWTFKKTEKREIYETNLDDFKKYIKERALGDIVYYYINISKLKYNDIKRLYNIIFNNSLNRDINYIIIDKDMLYYSLDNNKSIGISFQALRYCGIDKDKIIKKLRRCKNNTIYFTNSKNMWKLKQWFNGVEFVIPSILSE